MVVVWGQRGLDGQAAHPCFLQRYPRSARNAANRALVGPYTRPGDLFDVGPYLFRIVDPVMVELKGALGHPSLIQIL